MCPRKCGINRNKGETGYCGIDASPRIYQHFLHLGEEMSIIPAFIVNMAGCHLDCPTCPEKCRFQQASLRVGSPQNYAHALAKYFQQTTMPKSIEWIGGEPSIQLPFVLETSKWLKNLIPQCPTIYLNTNAYFSVELLAYMHDIIDAFVFDLKATQTCEHIVGNAPDYWSTATQCIQTAVQSYPADAPHILRHLVMPGHLECCTAPILEWCQTHIPQVCLNLMTTFHDFRSETQGPTELTETEIQKAKALVLQNRPQNLMINGATVLAS